MPVYNKGLFISKALDSVLTQEVNFEYEILIIDDCSRDNSVETIQKYLKEYTSKIRFIRNKNNMKLLFTV
jgi:glucosyltransferase